MGKSGRNQADIVHRLIFSLIIFAALCQCRPSEVRLGIQCNAKWSGGIDWSAVRSCHAFMLAVRHIKNKTDGVLDNILLYTDVKVAVVFNWVSIIVNMLLCMCILITNLQNHIWL